MDSTWPMTAVTLKWHRAPLKSRSNSCTSCPPRRERCLPSERKPAMDAASEGFSATHITTGRPDITASRLSRPARYRSVFVVGSSSDQTRYIHNYKSI